MKHQDLDAWIRGKDMVTTQDLLKLYGKKNFGGPTWLDLSRILLWHGFARMATGWTRTKPSPAGCVPTQQQLRREAKARRARCAAALAREEARKPKPVVYDPIHHDPEIQEPKDG